MISFASIWAIVLRHTRMWRRDPNYLLSLLYWPLLDVLVWGWLGSWIARSDASLPNYQMVALLGILLWQVVGRGSNIMLQTFNEELWSSNIVNLFSLPLALIEWIGGMLLFCVITVLITFIFSIVAIGLLYDVSLWQIIQTYLIFMPPLLFSCFWIGFSCLQIVTILGKRGTELGFVIGWLLMPFCGAYYPIEVLPRWGQVVSSFLPMSYVFQGMRKYVMYQQDPTFYLIKGYALSIVYAIVAVLLFMYCFNRSKKGGLARLVD
jgi:ABC-2 type transport system permease protein